MTRVIAFCLLSPSSGPELIMRPAPVSATPVAAGASPGRSSASNISGVITGIAPVTGAIPVITPEMLEADDLPGLAPAATGVALTGAGRMINSGPLDGLSKQNAITRVIELLEAAGTGRAAKTYR